MTGVDDAVVVGVSGIVISYEVGWIDPERNRHPHIPGGGTEIIVGYVHVVLGCRYRVPVYQKPGLICAPKT